MPLYLSLLSEIKIKNVFEETVMGETEMTCFLLNVFCESPDKRDLHFESNHMMLILLNELGFPPFASVAYLSLSQIHRYV